MHRFHYLLKPSASRYISVWNQSLSRYLGKSRLFPLILAAAFVASCSDDGVSDELLPTIAPSAMVIADTSVSPSATLTPSEKPPLPQTSTPLPEAILSTDVQTGTMDELTEIPVTTAPSPTEQRSTALPTPLIPTPNPSPTPSPTPSPGATATDGPTPLQPIEPWPNPTEHPFPVSESPRHGVAVAFGSGANSGLKANLSSWTYSWTAHVPKGESYVQHSPMLTGGPSSGLPSVETIIDMDERADHDYWLVFNECEQHWQCDATPQEAADFFHDEIVTTMYEQGADSDAKLIVGGINAHACGILWLTEFLTYYEDNFGTLPRAGWHFHIYPEIEPNTWPNNCSGQWDFNDNLFISPEAAFNLWLDRMEGVLAFIQQYGTVEDEIWITEMGCLNHGYHQAQSPVCQRSEFMITYAPKILEWLNNEGRWVTRYAWFTNWDDNYWDATKLFSSIDGPWTYSSLGWFYTQIQPASGVSIPVR